MSSFMYGTGAGGGGVVGGMARPLSKKLGESPGGWNEETESHG